MMHRGFYPKLAAGNLWRSRRTYAPYLLACVVSIFTFYTMVAINMNGALDGIRAEAIVKSFTLIGTVILAIFCSILIFYTNSFLIKRRKKELGLYSILGLEKKNIALVMFFETLFVAGIALVLGLGLGMLLSKLLFWVLLHMLRLPVMMEMPISPSGLVITAAFFGVIFLLALLTNLWQVRLANPVDLMAGAKQGEREPKSSLLLTLAGLLLLGGGYFMALYFQSPTEALLLFLVAALLVILGTYCLFTSGSVALLKLLRKNKKYYYQPQHFISVSGMIYRMKQNAAGLATICVLSCMVLVTVSSTVSLNMGAEDSLKMQYPYEYSMDFFAPADGDAFLAAAEQTAEKTGARLATLQDYRQVGFGAREEAPGQFVNQDFSSDPNYSTFALLTLKDYNRNEGASTTLAEGEALLLVAGGEYSGDTLFVDGVLFQVRRIERLGNTVRNGRELMRRFVMVLPTQADIDAVLNARVMTAITTRTLAFDLDGTEEEMAAFRQDYGEFVESVTSTQNHFQYRAREENRQDWYASNGGFLFLGVYFGILFMLAAALIIYYKQMSEGYDDAGRFEILQKVGMSEAEVKKTIDKQILAVFFLPLLVAVVHIVVAFFPVSRVMIVFGVVNIPLLAVCCAFTVLAYALVYLLVFRRTARTYFSIVRRQAASS